MGDAWGHEGPTKFIITSGDLRVCPICQAAERDGVIPSDRPYSNGMMHPPFHGKTCRCKEVRSDDLAQAVEVKANERSVDVGILDPQKAGAAAIREWGSGNGPPNPDVSRELDNVPPEVFIPLFDDLSKHYKNRFMK